MPTIRDNVSTLRECSGNWSRSALEQVDLLADDRRRALGASRGLPQSTTETADYRAPLASARMGLQRPYRTSRFGVGATCSESRGAPGPSPEGAGRSTTSTRLFDEPDEREEPEQRTALMLRSPRREARLSSE